MASDMCDVKENLISVIMPVYNTEKYLRSSIESVIKQSYENFELIIVDDGSTDSSYSIMSDMACRDGRIRIVKQENQGVSATRNHGLKLAEGDYISFIDSDDEYDTDYLKVLHTNAIEENADIAMCGIKEISGKENSIETDITYNSVEKLKKDYYHLFENGYLNSPCNKLYKRKVINTTFPDKISIGEDMIFNLKVLQGCNRVKAISQCLYNYNTATGGLHIIYHDNEFIDRFYMLKEVKDFLGEDDNKRKAATVAFSTYFTCLQHLIKASNLSTKEKKSIYNRWRKSKIIRGLHGNYSIIDRKLKLLFKHESYWLWSFYINIFSRAC